MRILWSGDPGSSPSPFAVSLRLGSANSSTISSNNELNVLMFGLENFGALKAAFSPLTTMLRNGYF
jgi:hypothetical protein